MGNTMLRYYCLIAYFICLELVISFSPSIAEACIGHSECDQAFQGPICVGEVHKYVFSECPHYPTPDYECNCGCLDNSDCASRKSTLYSGNKCVPSFKLGIPHCGCISQQDCDKGQYCSYKPGAFFLTCVPAL